jgi:hypothetical protein
MHRTGMLQYLNNVRQPLLPDILSELLLMSTSRLESERLCAFEFLASSCCTDVPENRRALQDQGLLRQITKWLSAPGSTERSAALSILLPFFEQDPACMETFVGMPGTVKAVFASLRLSLGDTGEDDMGCSTLASDAVRKLSTSRRFINGMFSQDVCGLQGVLVALSSVGVGASARAAAPAASSVSSGSAAFNTVLKFTWDATSKYECTLSDSNRVATSPGWVRGNVGISSGKALWYVELTKDMMNDERSTIGVCNSSPSSSYNSSGCGWWVTRSYNGQLGIAHTRTLSATRCLAFCKFTLSVLLPILAASYVCCCCCCCCCCC